jgi:hypothetical protein
VNTVYAHLAILKIGLAFKNNEEVGVAWEVLQSIKRKFDAQQGFLENFKEILKTFSTKQKCDLKIVSNIFYGWMNAWPLI